MKLDKQIRVILTFFLLLVANTSWAETLKLQCDLKINLTYINGAQENEVTTAIVEITEFSNYLAIAVSNAEPLISLNNKLSENVISVDNNSDRNRWNLQQERRDSNKANDPSIVQSITIDRNTGMLAYRRNFKNRLITTGSGYCSKVNTEVRKF